MNAATILIIMTSLFLIFGYMGVPVAFSLTAGVIVGAAFTDVTFAAIVQKMFDGVDSEALLAIPFFLLVGELMSSASSPPSSPPLRPSQRSFRHRSPPWSTVRSAMYRSRASSWRASCRAS
jgi:hypothetical protein